MKSNDDDVLMGIDISFITGMMLGVEIVEDEDYTYFFMDLLIIRVTFFKAKE